METFYPRIPRELLPREHVCNFCFPSFNGLLTQFQWFPDMYYGQGQRGHRYHVFDEVRPPKRNVVLSIIFTKHSPCITGFPDVKVAPAVTLIACTVMISCIKSARASRGREPLGTYVLEYGLCCIHSN